MENKRVALHLLQPVKIINSNPLCEPTTIHTKVVNSAFVSYAGATSTISAETMRRPSRPLRMVRSSLVDHPPVSGVPVAGAKAGSIVSIYVVYSFSMRRVTKVTATALTSIDRYTGPSPTVSRIFLIIPSVPEGITLVTVITEASRLLTKNVYFSSFNPLETDVVIVVIIVWAG